MKAEEAGLLRQVRAAIAKCHKQLDILSGTPRCRDSTYETIEVVADLLHSIELHLAGDQTPKKAGRRGAPGSFYRWLIEQRKEDSPIGDLARDAADDRNFPRTRNDLDGLLAHLVSGGACDAAREALKEAHCLWTETS